MSKFGAQNMVSQLKKVLMKRPQNFMSKVDLQKWNYTSPLDQDILYENYNEFYKIIKNSGAEIVDLKLTNENEELCDSIFTHDPSLVLNDGAIILNMGKNLRKKETEEHTNFYNEEKIPIIGKVINTGTVEGGDCLWINNKTLIIGESYRTNKDGINQLNNILNFHNVKLIPIKLPQYNSGDSCFHLMSLISMLDHNLAIGCLSLLPENVINILKNQNIELIEIPEDEYFNSKTLSVNILALSPRNLVAMKGYPKTIELLIKSGCKINLFSGNELCIKAEGGATCLTRPIWRE
jgi:N-dimethylarginine dimethylaminohydrolase